jgi:hypothetical protein
MPVVYFCGKQGSIAIGGVPYPLTNWELSSEVTTPEISNFTVPLGQQMYCPNLIGGTITCEGFLTSVGVPSAAILPGYPTAGSYAEFTLGVGLGLSYTVAGLITNITPSQDIQDTARFSIEAQISPNPANL